MLRVCMSAASVMVCVGESSERNASERLPRVRVYLCELVFQKRSSGMLSSSSYQVCRSYL